MFKAVEICAGAGGQSLGLEQAGFEHAALVELDPWACATLRHNRPGWNVIQADVREVDGSQWHGIDLLAGGVPCPPFSVAGKQLGRDDDRDLFPEVVRLAGECEPAAIFVENVRGLLDARFDSYRHEIERELKLLGYEVAGWKLLQASDFGVPQLRPRVVMVALRPELVPFFSWPTPRPEAAPTVGQALHDAMAERGWSGADEWAKQANDIAPTLVGGSKLHGGPDLGPTRARKAWATLGVEGRTIAPEPPAPDHVGMPRLTVQMAGLLQGFPPDWHFVGKKTNSYKQVGNAFPPPVARAVAEQIRFALKKARAGKAA